MPEIRDYYSHVKDMDLPALHGRRNEIMAGKSPGEFRTLDDESLAELLAITRELRKRAVVSPTRTARKKKTRTEEESLDALI